MVVVSLESYAHCAVVLFFYIQLIQKKVLSALTEETARVGVRSWSCPADRIWSRGSKHKHKHNIFSSLPKARRSRARALTRSPRGNPNASKGKAVRSPVQAVEGPLGNQPPQKSRARRRSAATCAGAPAICRQKGRWRGGPRFRHSDAGVSADGVWGPPGVNLVALWLGLPTCQASGVASPRFPACLPATAVALLFSAVGTQWVTALLPAAAAAAPAPQNSSVLLLP